MLGFLYLHMIGIHDVMHDNRTEHLRTINILERFNIYQEVILAALYRILPIQVCSCFLKEQHNLLIYICLICGY